MRYTAPDPKTDWELLEIVRRDRRPCSDAYSSANDEELVRVFGQLLLLRAAGCPSDRERGSPAIQRVEKYKVRGSRQTIAIYVLKTTPSSWRLYFFVQDPKQRRIVFLYAVSKKTNKRDPADIKRCRKLWNALDSGDYHVEPLELPHY
jgi:hypothetical protein